MFKIFVACIVAATLCPSLAAAQTQPPLNGAKILAGTLANYAKSTSLKGTLSIEQWCHDALIAINFDRDQFVLMRGIALNDNTKATALLIVAAKLRALEDQEADLLCAPGALQ